MASASLTGLPNNHRSFDLPIAGIVHTLAPHYYRGAKDGETEDQFTTRCAQELEAADRQGRRRRQVAAMICEPVMGAGGVIVPPKGYYEKIQAVCRKYDMLFVADEVICGFGRTGNVWGSQTMNIKPDILTCAKALSASFLPISAVMVNEKVYQALMSESDKIGTWATASPTPAIRSPRPSRWRRRRSTTRSTCSVTPSGSARSSASTSSRSPIIRWSARR